MDVLIFLIYSRTGHLVPIQYWQLPSNGKNCPHTVQICLIVFTANIGDLTEMRLLATDSSDSHLIVMSGGRYGKVILHGALSSLHHCTSPLKRQYIRNKLFAGLKLYNGWKIHIHLHSSSQSITNAINLLITRTSEIFSTTWYTQGALYSGWSQALVRWTPFHGVSSPLYLPDHGERCQL